MCAALTKSRCLMECEIGSFQLPLAPTCMDATPSLPAVRSYGWFVLCVWASTCCGWEGEGTMNLLDVRGVVQCRCSTFQFIMLGSVGPAS